MADQISVKVKEGWLGPGRSDGKIIPIPPADDAMHTDLGKKGTYEWWYFDAHLEGGYIIVAFFYASNPNPGTAGKTGVELTLIRPDGRKTQRFIAYPGSEFKASTEKADVKIGRNYLKSDWTAALPVYEIHIEEEGIGFDLTYASQVNGWKPGSGSSNFAGMGFFSWVVPIPRAAVQGTIRDGETIMPVKGVGYHDHNWLNFPFQRIIEYWMWGRVYSENFTISYAFIQCNKSVERHAVKVLMLAKNENVILSTGEYGLEKRDLAYSPAAGHSYPRELVFSIPGKFEMDLRVQKVLEQVNMLDNFGAALQFVAKTILRIKPGYFRLLSDFNLKVAQDGSLSEEKGTALHEIVAFKPIE
jgi:predicted secreted hydrolase